MYPAALFHTVILQKSDPFGQHPCSPPRLSFAKGPLVRSFAKGPLVRFQEPGGSAMLTGLPPLDTAEQLCYGTAWLRNCGCYGKREIREPRWQEPRWHTLVPPAVKAFVIGPTGATSARRRSYLTTMTLQVAIFQWRNMGHVSIYTTPGFRF